MVWGAFCQRGTSPLMILEGHQNSTAYMKTLEEGLLPFAAQKYGNNWIFQQDRASIHTSGATMEWMEQHNMEVLDWPSRSPDLNPIENLWGSLVRRVYAGGRQFQSVHQLKVFLHEWSRFPTEELINLVGSMPKRCQALLEGTGTRPSTEKSKATRVSHNIRNETAWLYIHWGKDKIRP